MDYKAILEKARTERKFVFMRIPEFKVEDMRITVSLETRVTPIDCFQFGACGGQGFTIEFTPKFGMWVGEIIGWWVGE